MRSRELEFDRLLGEGQGARPAESLEKLEQEARANDSELLEIEERLGSLLGLEPGQVPRITADNAHKSRIAAMLLDADYRKLAASRTLIRLDRLPIPRGNLDLYCTFPRLSKEFTPVLYYTVIALPYGDSILRENHDNKGYHLPLL